MIDTHAHLDFENFDQDREEVISRAFDNRVKKIINIGVDLATSKKSIALAKKHDEVFSSVGLHPDFFTKHETRNKEQDWVDDLRSLAKHEKVVAIGETGLDYFSHTGELVTTTQKENQKKGFLAQIELAKELDLPVIVHCRNAWEDLYKMINTKFRDTKFQLHCYSGSVEDTEIFLKFPNIHFSFSGNITYPKPAGKAKQFEEVIKMIPLGRIMLDSDSPYLAPQQFRGKRNEPSYIRYIAEKIAEIRNIGYKDVEKATDENAEIFFGLNF